LRFRRGRGAISGLFCFTLTLNETSRSSHDTKFWSRRREVIAMDWKNLTPDEKARLLSQQLEDIGRARVVLERFEQLTQKWLKRVQATRKEA
jgi:hypothetical protein